MKHYARSRAWCEWAAFDDWHAQALQDLTDPSVAAWSPFHLLSLPGITAAQQRHAAHRWMAARLLASQADRDQLAAEFSRKPHQGPANADGAAPPRLRVGYLSNDFHQHATALLLVEMLEAHDRERFELFAYSYGGDDGQGMRQRLQACFDRFTDIGGLDDMAAARAIHGDGIQILVDLKGYTAATRTALLTYRPAPVQVSYLGYPGTLGGGFSDYLISDHFITPPAAAADYSEALACLPHSYQPHGRGATMGPAPSRAEAGLPETGLVFCCFNQAWKFTPEVFALWCKLLAQVPDSVLWLLQDDQARGNLRREALAHGVDPHRLVFAAPLPQAAHLARLPLADLVLDTAPYNAHTTASDALWAGVPVVTWAGDTFAGRVAGSLLHAVGLPELVTEGPTAYAELALALATDATRRQALRHRLWQRRGTAPLFDVLGYTAALEGLFLQMWQRHADGLAPAHLGVASPPDTNQPAAYGDVPSTSLNTLTACTRAPA